VFSRELASRVDRDELWRLRQPRIGTIGFSAPPTRPAHAPAPLRDLGDQLLPGLQFPAKVAEETSRSGTTGAR